MARSKEPKYKSSQRVTNVVSHPTVAVAEKVSKKSQKQAQAELPEPEDVPATGDSDEASEEGEDANSEDDSEDDEDIDEEGMTRLMKALGEDGLDDFAQAELRALAGEDSDESSEEDNNEEGEGSEDEEGEEAAASDAPKVQESEAEEEDSEDEAEEQASGEEDEAIALDEVEDVEEDIVPRQKVEIDNKIALERIRDTIKLDASIPWTDTLVVSYPETIDVDVNDDLNRELAIYKQALHGAQLAKTLAAKHNFPFTRPSDYFAEMVKSDAHMERIRQRLLDEGASIKRSEEKRKEREGKKYGKQVQMEKLKERERSKKDMEERLKGLKRKRKDALDNAQEDDDGFDVAVEDAISDRPNKRSRGGAGGKRPLNRQARDSKFGFGGPGRHSKQNTKDSTDDFEPRGGRSSRGSRGGRGGARGGRGGRGGARGGSKRPGKSKRVTARSRS